MFKNKTLLLPTDFSSYAKHASEYALAIAKKYECEVDIVHVAEIGRGYTKPMEEVRSGPGVFAQFEEKLSEIGSTFRAHGLRVNEVLLEGKAWISIVEYAKNKDIGLITIATHGKTGWDRLVFGSVAERVVRHSTVPVLTVKPHEKECIDKSMSFSVKHVLVPTDFSLQADKAVRYAVSLCREFAATLSLVNVVEIPTVVPELMPETTATLGSDMTDSAQELLKRVAQSVTDVPTSIHLRVGIAYREICCIVEEIGADLLVIPKHSGGSFLHVLFGSVAEKVVRKAPCPVLTLPITEDDGTS